MYYIECITHSWPQGTSIAYREFIATSRHFGEDDRFHLVWYRAFDLSAPCLDSARGLNLADLNLARKAILMHSLTTFALISISARAREYTCVRVELVSWDNCRSDCRVRSSSSARTRQPTTRCSSPCESARPLTISVHEQFQSEAARHVCSSGFNCLDERAQSSRISNGDTTLPEAPNEHFQTSYSPDVLFSV